MTDITLAYITCANIEEAKSIGKILLDDGLIACANIFPILSMYNWKGNLKEDNESVLICKTTEQRFDKLMSRVKKIHSYDVPCILKINSSANVEFAKWVNEETNK